MDDTPPPPRDWPRKEVRNQSRWGIPLSYLESYSVLSLHQIAGVREEAQQLRALRQASLDLAVQAVPLPPTPPMPLELKVGLASLSEVRWRLPSERD